MAIDVSFPAPAATTTGLLTDVPPLTPDLVKKYIAEIEAVLVYIKPLDALTGFGPVHTVIADVELVLATIKPYVDDQTPYLLLNAIIGLIKTHGFGAALAHITAALPKK